MKIIVIVLICFSLSNTQDHINYNSIEWSCNPNTIKSPIDINYLNPQYVKFPSFPAFAFNSTFYSPINNRKFYKKPQSNTCNSTPSYNDLIMDLDGFGQAYVLYLNKTVKYNLKELRLRVYSEHTFEGGKMDLELQIIHDLDDESKSVLPTTKYGEKLGISVLFSISKDKNNKLLEQIIEEDTDQTDETKRYTFALVTALDLNKFTNFHEPYFFYVGTGTTPYDCCETVSWVIMKKVEYMSQEQLRQIQLAMKKEYSELVNGNAISVVSSRTEVEYIANEEREEDE